MPSSLSTSLTTSWVPLLTPPLVTTRSARTSWSLSASAKASGSSEVDADPVGDAAVRAHGGGEQVAVGVVDAVAAQRPAGLDELGAGRHHHDARARRGRHAAEAERREQADLAGADDLAATHQQVALLRPPRRRGGCAGPRRAPGGPAPRGPLLGPLERHHRVGARRDRRAGHDADGGAGRQREDRGLPGGDLADDRQVHRALGGGVGDVAERHGVAVHAGVVEDRQRDLRRGRPRRRRGRGRPSAGARRAASARSGRAPGRGGPRPDSGGVRVGRTWRRAYAEERVPSPSTVPASTRPRSPVERGRALDLDALAEAPVAGDDQRVGLLQRRHAGGEALVELLDQLVVRRRGRRTAASRPPGRARSRCRGRRRPSAAPAGRWSSSPARTGRGRPRSCASPRRPRSPRPSRSRSGSPWGSRGRRGRRSSRCGSAAGRARRRGGRSRRASGRGRTRGCWWSRTGGARGPPARPGRPRRSARSRAARSGRRPCGARSGRPCGPRGYAAPPRSRTGHRTRRTSRPPGRPGTAPRLSELETKA